MPDVVRHLTTIQPDIIDGPQQTDVLVMGPFYQLSIYPNVRVRSIRDACHISRYNSIWSWREWNHILTYTGGPRKHSKTSMCTLSIAKCLADIFQCYACQNLFTQYHKKKNFNYVDTYRISISMLYANYRLHKQDLKFVMPNLFLKYQGNSMKATCIAGKKLF